MEYDMSLLWAWRIEAVANVKKQLGKNQLKNKKRLPLEMNKNQNENQSQSMNMIDTTC